MKHLLYSFLLLPSLLISQAISANQWKEDIAFLQKELPKKHIDLFHKLPETSWNNQLNELMATVDVLKKDELLWSLTKVLSSVEDSHTSLRFKNKKNAPLTIYKFESDYYIVAIHKKFKASLASKIISVNGTSISEFEKEISKIVFFENQASMDKGFPKLITNKSLLDFLLKKNNQYLILELENGAHENSTLTIPFSNGKVNKKDVSTIAQAQKPLYKSQRKWFWYKQIDRTLYFKYNKCNSKENVIEHNGFFKASDKEIEKLPLFSTFKNELITVLNTGKINKLILDLRGNPGGNSKLAETLFIEVLKTNFYKDSGKVVTLVNRDVFSSAILNAMQSKKLLQATIIGEETSGSPNHFGEIRFLQLPNSKLKVSYSTRHFQEKDINSNTIIPDIVIKESILDYKNGNDPVLKKALDLQ